MHYKLPRTDVAVNLSLRLQDCTSLAVTPKIKLAPKAGAQSKVYSVPGAALASSRIKRELKIGISELGVIKSVNSANSERSPQIAANYIKTAAQFAPLILGATATGAPLQCTTETSSALNRAKKIKLQMRNIRSRLNLGGSIPSGNDNKLMEQFSNLAAELGALESILNIDTTGKIKLDGAAPPAVSNETPIDIDAAPFKKWFGPFVKKDRLGESFGLVWTATPIVQTIVPPVGVRNKKLRKCKLHLTTPKVSYFKIKVSGAKKTVISDLEKEAALPIAQWATANSLCVDVGFGENRSIGLTFDKFGRTTEYAWSSDATAETVSAALAGAAPDISSLTKTIRGGTELDAQKAEIDELETEAKLEKLRACKAIRESGGSCEVE